MASGMRLPHPLFIVAYLAGLLYPYLYKGQGQDISWVVRVRPGGCRDTTPDLGVRVSSLPTSEV